MSGRKQFNEFQAIDAATRHFWQHGFARSSINDLECATGLNKSSLYNTFKSKDALYLRCLTHFDQSYAGRLVALLEHENFHQGLNDFFSTLLRGFEDPSLPEGCLATAAALEMGNRNNAISEQIQHGITSMLTNITRRCELAVRSGDLTPETDCDALAATIIAVSRGAIVLYMGTGNLQASRQACEYLLKSLQ
ncbi:TetR family transcriptional regulator [Alteromonadaceae bacterium 2753L.S.0a.02]|nr:TetR family transcriptional regulator [Alteromonadaceae bacterium 2753L.S.0a.02]